MLTGLGGEALTGPWGVGDPDRGPVESRAAVPHTGGPYERPPPAEGAGSAEGQSPRPPTPKGARAPHSRCRGPPQPVPLPETWPHAVPEIPAGSPPEVSSAGLSVWPRQPRSSLIMVLHSA